MFFNNEKLFINIMDTFQFFMVSINSYLFYKTSTHTKINYQLTQQDSAYFY